MVFHELAHAWDHHNLSDEDRRAFLNHTGLTSWNDPGARWGEQGAEVAANAVAWSLLDVPLTPSQATSFAEQFELFELLSGVTTLRFVSRESPSRTPTLF